MNIFISIITILMTFHLHATTTQDAYKMVLDGQAVLVDVREEIETRDGIIKNALLFPLSKTRTDSDWKQNFTKLVGNKKIFLYCRSGKRSGDFLQLLKNAEIDSENLGGYLNLKNELPTTRR